MNTKETRRFFAKLMAGAMLLIFILGTPGIAYAAQRVMSNWGSITITRDVSADVYLSDVFSLGGNNFVGFVQDPVSRQTFFATSDDALNWELQSEFFTLVYGRDMFVGVNQEGLHFTDNGTNWRVANLPEGIVPYSVKYENGMLKLYYRIPGMAFNESGLMLSEDAETWYDITEYVPENVRPRDVFVLEDRVIALGNTNTGADGMTVMFATEIDENNTQWENIESLARPGFGFEVNQVIFDGQVLALRTYDLQSRTSEFSRDASNDVYVVTRDFINWEEKTWPEQGDNEAWQEWWGFWPSAAYYRTARQTSTLTTPFFDIDGNRFRSMAVLPFTEAGVPHVYAYANPWDVLQTINAGLAHWQTIIEYSQDGTSWSNAAAAINLDGQRLNRPITSLTATDLSSASGWAYEHILRAIELELAPANLQRDFARPTTRAEFTAFAVALYEAATGQVIAGRMQFNDTTDTNVQMMGYLGVVTGVGNDNFNPNGELTREQAAVMIARLAYVIGQPLEASLPTFADNASISAWALEEVGQMQASGIMGGVGDNYFAPGGDYTREQSIITILRLFDILN